jgi:hypothetical protein
MNALNRSMLRCHNRAFHSTPYYLAKKTDRWQEILNKVILASLARLRVRNQEQKMLAIFFVLKNIFAALRWSESFRELARITKNAFRRMNETIAMNWWKEVRERLEHGTT